jgi:hypothetical protein
MDTKNLKSDGTKDSEVMGLERLTLTELANEEKLTK